MPNDSGGFRPEALLLSAWSRQLGLGPEPYRRPLTSNYFTKQTDLV